MLGVRPILRKCTAPDVVDNEMSHFPAGDRCTLRGQAGSTRALIEEPEIHSALRFMMVTEHQVDEGSAAMAIAAGLKTGRSRVGKTTAIVSCGANISSAALSEAIGLARQPGDPGTGSVFVILQRIGAAGETATS